MPKTQELNQLIASCLDEILEHLMQDSINSSHIRNIKNNLLAMRSLIIEAPPNLRSNSPPGISTSKNNRRRSVISNENKSDILKMAYALSKYDHHCFNNMFGIHLNQSSVIRMVAAFFDIKQSTLRNYRDAFDNRVQQVNSNRTGRVMERLPLFFQEAMETCNAMTEEELTAEIRKILGSRVPSIDLVTKIAYAFLGCVKATRTTSSVTLHGQKFDVIVAPYLDRVAYMVFMSFGNALAKGIYPAIYVYRKFGKAFTVFGESETSAPADSWNFEQETYPKIKDFFSPDEITEINKYPNTYLDNRVYRVYDIEPDSFTDGVYMLALAREMAKDLNWLIERYVVQYS